MLDGWRELTVGEVADVYDGPHATPPKAESGPIFLGISNLESGRLNLTDTEHVSEQDFRLWTRRVTPQADDLVFSYETRLGEAAVVPNGLRCCLGRRMGLLRARREQVDPRFLLYAYISPAFQEVLRARTIHGSTVDRIPLIELPSFPLVLPPLPEQRAIAAVLSALDDKIDLNRRMNETLEELAHALFRSWFVDFDPVRAKSEARQPFGLEEAAAAVFPDGLEDSALGEVPRGWAVVAVADLATYINGAAYSAFQPNDNRRGLPIIKIAELKAGVTAQTRFSDVSMEGRYRIERGELLFSWSGNPDTSIDTFVWPFGTAWLNQHIFKVVPRSAEERAFVLATLKYLRPVFAEIARNKQTTGLGHVTAADLKRLLVVRPDPETLRVWSLTGGALQQRCFANAVEIAELASLREYLLPKLLSGEVRVRDAEKIVGTAT